MRILGVDPGQSDPFACVLVEVLDNDPHVYILGAKFWKNQKYKAVEAEIAKIAQENSVDYLIVERNSAGKRIIESLTSEYDLPIISIFTSNNTTKDKGDIMDKSLMTNWLIEKQQEGLLVWPDAESDYMKELMRQWNIFGEYKSGKYAAPSGEHDDLVMALMLACYYVSKSIDPRHTVMINANKIGSTIEEKINTLNEEAEEMGVGLRWETK